MCPFCDALLQVTIIYLRNVSASRKNDAPLKLHPPEEVQRKKKTDTN